MLKKLSLAAALVAFTFVSAVAAEPKIVVVDIQRIMRESLAAKDLKAELESKKNQYQTSINAKKDKLTKEMDDLVKQKNVLAKDALAEKQKSFVAERDAVIKDARDKQISFDNAYKNALGEIQKAVQSIIEDMAKEQGFNMAIPTSQLIYASGDFDVSNEVLKRLDKKLPKVSLKFEK
jgi:outer membrane protein